MNPDKHEPAGCRLMAQAPRAGVVHPPYPCSFVLSYISVFVCGFLFAPCPFCSVSIRGSIFQCPRGQRSKPVGRSLAPLLVHRIARVRRRPKVATTGPIRFSPRALNRSTKMRVSVMQMNPGADKAKTSPRRAPADRCGGRAPTAPTSSACPRSGFASAATAPRAPPTPRPCRRQAPTNPAARPTSSCAKPPAARKVHVHGGSIIEQGPEKLFNTTVVFDPDGTEIARYRKMHLFDIVAPDGTGYRESTSYGAGDEVVTYQAGGMKVGCAICYDVRFPDLFWELREHGAELIFLPRAFTARHRQGPLGGADPRPRDRDPVLVRRPRHLGQTPGGQGRAALHLRPLDGGATPGATSSPKSPTASAGPPRASTRR